MLRHERCVLPLAPNTVVPEELRMGLPPSHSDRDSPYWKGLRKAAPNLTKAQKAWTNGITVELGSPDETQQSPLERQLQVEFEWCLMNTKAKEQHQRFFLLHGPSGTSKTYAAKATALRMGLAFMQVIPSQVNSKMIGETGKVLMAIFRKAALNQPCMLFFDEFEELGGSRERLSEYSAALTGELLQHIGGLEGQVGTVIVACTNMLSSIDSAILGRAGDGAIEVPAPEQDMRRVAWQNELQEKNIQVTSEELEQLCARQLQGNMRGIANAIARFQKRGKKDVMELIKAASELAVLDDDDPSDLDDAPEDQHGWRLDAPKYLAPQLLPAGACTRISSNIHKAIPAHLENWRDCMSEAAKQVNVVVAEAKLSSYQLGVASEAKSWLVTSDQHTLIVIPLNIHIHSAHHGELEAVRDEVRALKAQVRDQMAKYDTLAEQFGAFVSELRGQKHPRSPGETSQCLRRKKPCSRGKVNAAALDESTESDTDESTESDADKLMESDMDDPDTPMNPKKTKKDRRNKKNENKKKKQKKKKKKKEKVEDRGERGEAASQRRKDRPSADLLASNEDDEDDDEQEAERVQDDHDSGGGDENDEEQDGSDADLSASEDDDKEEKQQKKKTMMKKKNNKKNKKNKKNEELAALREEVDMLKKNKVDEEEKEEEEASPICSKKHCYTATTRLLNGKWRRQCCGCLSRCSKKKKTKQ
jgi:SpoVK/Ycf46/Vps4 family AAA+-type ATPase